MRLAVLTHLPLEQMHAWLTARNVAQNRTSAKRDWLLYKSSSMNFQANLFGSIPWSHCMMHLRQPKNVIEVTESVCSEA